MFEHKCHDIQNRWGLTISTKDVRFSGLRTIHMDSLTVIPDGFDTLLCTNTVEVKLSITDLLFLKVNPLEIWLNDPKIEFVGEKGRANYSFLTNKKDSTHSNNRMVAVEENSNRNQYSIYRALKAIFGLTTSNFHVKNFAFSYADSTYSTTISIPAFESNKMGFNTLIEVKEDGVFHGIRLIGRADKEKNSFQMKAFSVGSKIPLPLLYHKVGINLSFDTAYIDVWAKNLNRDNIQLELKSSIKSLEVFSNRLSEQTVKVQHGAFNLNISATPDYYLIDSTSTAYLNGLSARIYLKYSPKFDKYLSFEVATGEFQAQRLFDVLPDGLFSNLKGIKTSGTIDYRLKLCTSLSAPDSVVLIPSIKTKDFSLVQYGSTNFAALNDTFSHDVYNEGQYIKTILIGSENPEFKRLNQISPFIANAIVTSEDGSFYFNNGFDLDALKYAISENIKQKRFARGGSTITMQLVKNLYLNQNKNLFRKAEEYIIVWLIESQHLVSKERLLEIYLNIIEWGPGIYGVDEACRYYFGKDPSNVTLDEAIYLACIIPRPAKFKYFFEKDGTMKPFMENNFSFIGGKMLQRGMVTQDDIDKLTYCVTLAGPAKELLIDTTSYELDSINTDEVSLDSDTSLLFP